LPSYINNLLAGAEVRQSSMLRDDGGQRLAERYMLRELESVVDAFVSGDTEERWIILPGLRGTGKSTLLAQLYFHLWDLGIDRRRVLFLSVDDLVLRIGSRLIDAIDSFEVHIGKAFETLNKGEEVFIILDEAHYDANWGLALKTIFDRSKRVFIISSGSSAIDLTTNADVARRAQTLRVMPLSFSEYRYLIHKANAKRSKGYDLLEIILRSSDSREVFDRLSAMKDLLTELSTSIIPLEMERYLKLGTMPFGLGKGPDELVYSRILDIENRVITKDLPSLGRFNMETLSKAQNLLTLLALSDRLSHESLARDLGINKITLANIIKALEMADIIYRIRPYGSEATRLRKTPKYKFVAPVFRTAHLWDLGRPIDVGETYGMLFEDVAAMYLLSVSRRSRRLRIDYDHIEGGIDFLVSMGPEKPVGIEVGYGTKGLEQFRTTSESVGMKYGILVADTTLKYHSEDDVVAIPREWFLMAL